MSFLMRMIHIFFDLISLRRLATINFFIHQRILGFQVPSSPHFDSDDSTNWFISRLQNCKCYLEFGSGGSTYLAAKYGILFITIESDKFFLKALKKKIKADNLFNQKRQFFHHANIGMTSHWGWPVMMFAPSNKKLASFRCYSDVPSIHLLKKFEPDLVLVDGRFRVACALKALKFMKGKSNWTIVVDDYLGRDSYYIISKFAKLEYFVGRMAIFTDFEYYDSCELGKV